MPSELIRQQTTSSEVLTSICQRLYQPFLSRQCIRDLRNTRNSSTLILGLRGYGIVHSCLKKFTILNTKVHLSIQKSIKQDVVTHSCNSIRCMIWVNGKQTTNCTWLLNQATENVQFNSYPQPKQTRRKEKGEALNTNSGTTLIRLQHDTVGPI